MSLEKIGESARRSLRERRACLDFQVGAQVEFAQEVDGLFERGHGLSNKSLGKPRSGVELAKFGGAAPDDIAFAVGCALQRCIVKQHQAPVPGQADIEFYPLDTDRRGVTQPD